MKKAILLALLVVYTAGIAFSQSASGSFRLNRFALTTLQESTTDEPYLLVFSIRASFGTRSQVTWNPASGPKSLRKNSSGVGQIDTLLLSTAYNMSFANLQPFEAYGVVVVAMEQDEDNSKELGNFVRSIRDYLQTVMDNGFYAQKAPADPAAHTRLLIQTLKKQLYGLDDNDWVSKYFDEIMDTFGDNDDLVGNAWAFSVNVPAAQETMVNQVAFKEVGFSPVGDTKAWYRFKGVPCGFFRYQNPRPFFLEMSGNSDGAYNVEIFHEAAAASGGTRPTLPNNPGPASSPAPRTQTEDCTFARSPKSLYLQPDFQRVETQIYDCKGMPYVALPELAEALGYNMRYVNNTIELTPKSTTPVSQTQFPTFPTNQNQQSLPLPPQGTKPAPPQGGTNAPQAGEVFNPGKGGTATALQATDKWELKLEEKAIRVNSPYAFQWRADMTPMEAEASGRYLLAIDGMLTLKGADASECYITGAENAVIGADGQSYPLKEIDADGSRWLSGQVTAMIPGSARPVRLLFEVPETFKLTKVRVQLPQLDGNYSILVYPVK